MDTVSFVINGKTHEFSIKGAPPFKYGKHERLSDRANDIAYYQDWYQEGYKAVPFLEADDFRKLREGLAKCIQTLIRTQLGIDVTDFDLTKYHHVVRTNEDHFKIISKTRDLFPGDFNFPIKDIFPKFEKILGFKLTDVDPFNEKQGHIIVRVHRPGSNDYNPPHKDIYEGVDQDSYIPLFINLWIPISGVTENSSLPMVPSSHLLTEDQILRTVEGGVLGGNRYRVRMVREWGGSNRLIRSEVNEGEVLLFTSHLIHGLGVNEEADTTRVALEFRLFKAE